ncbi:hypothetical protein [Microvirga puerhi]|uniref:HEPN AbiU2-like domain-containing protein n=1 Tax=Microvirga puerhi TaxID=2876078 RepID=A0ABS7VIH8_9HYPH|nr:hypothetical protein [Microvirga puerhi]MBZ6075299.1 hypothetical protein [Microvirga puerhi]
MAANDPKDLSFLTPSERIFVAKSRMQRLHEHLWGVIILQEDLRSQDKYNPLATVENRSVLTSGRVVTEVIGNTVILEIAAIWESFDAAGFSIPTFCTALNHPAVLDLIDKSYEIPPELPNPFGEMGPPKTEFSVVDTLVNAFDKAKSVEGGQTLLKIKNYRNTAAHPILTTREERRGKAPIGRPTWEETTEIVEIATDIVKSIAKCLFGFSHRYDEIRKVASSASDLLYSGIKYSPARAQRKMGDPALSAALTIDADSFFPKPDTFAGAP